MEFREYLNENTKSEKLVNTLEKNLEESERNLRAIRKNSGNKDLTDMSNKLSKKLLEILDIIDEKMRFLAEKDI